VYIYIYICARGQQPIHGKRIKAKKTQHTNTPGRLKRIRQWRGQWNRRALYTKLKNQTQSQNVEQEWDQIKRAIIEAAYTTIQTQSKKQKNEWWDKDCQLAIKEKNKARRIWLQHKTRARNAWCKKRNEANRMCIKKKKEWLNNVIKKIVESNKKNESKKFF